MGPQSPAQGVAVGGTVCPAAGAVGSAMRDRTNTTTNRATTAAIRMGDSLLYE
jgi:hypothetical protein